MEFELPQCYLATHHLNRSLTHMLKCFASSRLLAHYPLSQKHSYTQAAVWWPWQSAEPVRHGIHNCRSKSCGQWTGILAQLDQPLRSTTPRTTAMWRKAWKNPKTVIYTVTRSYTLKKTCNWHVCEEVIQWRKALRLGKKFLTAWNSVNISCHFQQIFK